ncbi:DUF2231 domain-containing protein [Flavobacterium sedimenticola]|uniref:DUF2231 domain-containing protein n=1 Tax=Flavobacterium sedimenticola TaxID=3043286 RepID=A0ABT6XTI7_9FLAO|nr:DUF2231 domain-containing protein [Flavobacterium sedimenticola]MDI9258333.1 hypothetical protein [Flavobacterium sedimenticola]
MNEAHLHLLVNHFPIIGTIFGLGILIGGIIFKNNAVKNTAFIVLIVATLFGAASMATGEGAEELVEDMPTVGKSIIHEHEELAEKFIVVLYVTGAFALLSLLANIKKHSKANLLAWLTLLLSIVAVVLVKEVGTSGGEIRHTEIRADASTQTNAGGENQSEHGEED